LVESFIVMEPYWTVRTGSVPFWMVFNKEPSAEALQAYFADGRRFDEVDLMLFSHGVDSVGLVSIDEWSRILKLGGGRTSFLGVDKRAYPRDFAVFVYYHEALVEKVKSRYAMPPPLSLAELNEFLNRSSSRYQVEWH
jgi:hypothetical protein